MNLERDKFLTEAMGECWHDWEYYDTDYRGDYTHIYECSKCKKEFHLEFGCRESELPNNTFSTWEGFGKLWEWATKQEWWYNFKIGTHCGLTIEGVYEYLINPDEFADTLYHYLK